MVRTGSAHMPAGIGAAKAQGCRVCFRCIGSPRRPKSIQDYSDYGGNDDNLGGRRNYENFDDCTNFDDYGDGGNYAKIHVNDESGSEFEDD